MIMAINRGKLSTTAKEDQNSTPWITVLLHVSIFIINNVNIYIYIYIVEGAMIFPMLWKNEFQYELLILQLLGSILRK